MTTQQGQRTPAAVRVLAVTILAVVAADQLTKQLVVSNIEKGDSISLGLGVRLVHTLNTGVAFSRFSGRTGVVVPVLLVVAGVGYFTYKQLHRVSIQLFGLALILGGALGNLVDRFLRSPRWGRGGVIDMVDVGWWPVFNVADSAVCLGVALVVYDSVFGASAKAAKQSPSEQARNDGKQVRS
jgi:signal peptidase II